MRLILTGLTAAGNWFFFFALMWIIYTSENPPTAGQAFPIVFLVLASAIALSFATHREWEIER